jgi:hypothetical protein
MPQSNSMGVGKRRPPDPRRGTGMRQRSGAWTATVWVCLSLGLGGCGAGPSGSAREKVYAPEDMPDICQDIDFNQAGSDLKAECGVKTRNYMAYRNIPEHRNLLLPKGAKIVRKAEGLELRLTNTLPIALPGDLEGKIRFDEKLRRNFIKNRMDYCEFFPDRSSERLRIMRLDIPLDAGGEESVCFMVGAPPTTAQRKAGYAGRLETLECADFVKLKEASLAQDGSRPEGTSEGDSAFTAPERPAEKAPVR